MYTFVGLAVLGLTLFLVGCGGATPTPTAQDEPLSWSEELTKEQQMDIMKNRVMPAMAPVFQAQDATRYEGFGCVTCHGPEYKEPDEFLPRLTMSGGTLTAFAAKPEVSAFMAEKVTPTMAAAMGLPGYDPATGKGFGCGGCHGVDMQQ